MIDFIMRLFGYENIDRIHICDDFKNKPPKKDKMDFRRYYYNVRKKFWVPIVVKKEYIWHNVWVCGGILCLVDGYTSYLIAKENNIKYVKVVRK